MSKTDKTRPFWVKLADHPRNYVEQHDHRDGVCDLPDSLNDPTTLTHFTWARGNCYYSYSPAWINSGAARCGCQFCQWPWERRASARRSRQNARREANAWRQEYSAQSDIYDW